ncbi:hypothetical protein KVV02_006635 [Mortierella alpina]|uniref:F-box domain-containing protein n=1 Tax=Mortierella alpina TaxID=64518 RepID=A0A9P8A2U0_MORAP|nr:hypothetical protein KVV02_006635 [Mortierella alpina]
MPIHLINTSRNVISRTLFSSRTPHSSQIVAEIGQWLDGKTLLAALQVSKTWYKVHNPILWNSLTEPQWSHPRFIFYGRMGQGVYRNTREMRKLRIVHEDMVVLRYCPKLRELEIKLQARLFLLPQRPQAMMTCPELEVQRITAGPVFCDLAETFRSLKCLKVLLLPIRNVDQLESLCLPEDSQEVSSSGTLPISEHLELSDVQLDLEVTKSDNLH